jgi:hypothetical protein
MTESGRPVAGSGRFGAGRFSAGREAGFPMSDMTVSHQYDTQSYRSADPVPPAGSVTAPRLVGVTTVGVAG